MPRTSHGSRRNRPRSTDMPTAMKNRPSSRPLNGSMSSSSSWRYSLSASMTPARNAPSACDSPAHSISAAVPSTTSSEKPTNTSRSRACATKRSTGRTSTRPAAIKSTSTARGRAHPEQREPAQPPPQPRLRDEAQPRSHQHATRGDQEHDHAERLREAHQVEAFGIAAHHAENQEQRDDREVLEQQHGERSLD